MSGAVICDLCAAILLSCGAFFCVSAAVGILRFPDVITRLHAATKPQVFGLILILAAIVLAERSYEALGICVLVAAFQIATNPVSAHMVARSAYRTGLWDAGNAVVDGLAVDLEKAGYSHADDRVDDDLAAPPVPPEAHG